MCLGLRGQRLHLRVMVATVLQRDGIIYSEPVIFFDKLRRKTIFMA